MNPISPSILARTAGSAEARSTVNASLDRVILSGIRGPQTTALLGDVHPWSPDAVILTMDFHAPEVESMVPRARSRCRTWASAAGLKRIFDLNAGVGSMVAVEWGLVQPGQLVAGCGRCLGMVGGVGALGLRFDSPELARTIPTGKLEWTLPEIVSVEILGKLHRHIGAWDLADAVRQLLADRARGSIVEIGGEVESWPIGFRSSVSGLLVEMGAAAALVTPDATVVDHYRTHGVEVQLPEPDASRAAEFQLEGDAIRASAAHGYADPSSPLTDLDHSIDGVFLGSCYGGHLDDLAITAEILKKAGGVNPGVRLTLSATTLEVARAALNAGYYELFLQAGAIMAAPGLGAGAAGGGAILGEGERMASTVDYHRSEGPGAPEVLVMSPAAAAAAAACGRLVDPAEFVS